MTKGLKVMFKKRGGNYSGLRASEVPRWFIDHFANAKGKEMWMTRLFSHFYAYFQCPSFSYRQREDSSS
jgi:hypothetical protein